MINYFYSQCHFQYYTSFAIINLPWHGTYSIDITFELLTDPCGVWSWSSAVLVLLISIAEFIPIYIIIHINFFHWHNQVMQNDCCQGDFSCSFNVQFHGWAKHLPLSRENCKSAFGAAAAVRVPEVEDPLFVAEATGVRRYEVLPLRISCVTKEEEWQFCWEVWVSYSSFWEVECIGVQELLNIWSSENSSIDLLSFHSDIHKSKLQIWTNNCL